MTSISGSRSGGKMVRPRRTATARTTPYDRPAPSRSPNWFSRLVISPTRFVASGAGKLISTVLDLESSPTSSSSVTSSPSSSDTDSTTAEDVDTSDDEKHNPFEGDDALIEKTSLLHPIPSQKMLDESEGLQPLDWNSKNKRVIEQLVMQESFSREESDRLIKIIRSRVVDSPANDADGDKRLRGMPNRTPGSGSPDLCSAAVMEAKKWLQEKKSGLDSNSDFGYGSPSLNLATLSLAPKDEGSPVDVAKSYMRSRPPWASPSLDHVKPPTPVGIQLFKEETHLLGGNSTSSSKLKRDSQATGSWSIQDEIRRVRSRATEEMLRTLPSSKIDWSAFAIEYKNNVNSSAIENIEASLGEKVLDFTNQVDPSSNLARGLATQASPDLESVLDGFQPESVQSDPAIINSEQNQGSGAVQQTKGSQDDYGGITTPGQRDESSNDMHRDGGFVKVNGINNTNVANHQLDSEEETIEALNSRLRDGNYLEVKEKIGADDVLANGFPSSGPSLHAGQVIEQKTKTLDNEPDTVDLSQERTAKDVLDEEICNLLSESMEVPNDVIVNDTVVFKENDGVATGSQNSSSVQYEAQPDHSQRGSELDLAATSTSIAKQKGRRITSRYNRRGRGRSVK